MSNSTQSILNIFLQCFFISFRLFISLMSESRIGNPLFIYIRIESLQYNIMIYPKLFHHLFVVSITLIHRKIYAQRRGKERGYLYRHDWNIHTIQLHTALDFDTRVFPVDIFCILDSIH